ncbi:MAG: FliM/FliN family flagellar motor switch protein [Pseudomonadota bacterium]
MANEQAPDRPDNDPAAQENAQKTPQEQGHDPQGQADNRVDDAENGADDGTESLLTNEELETLMAEPGSERHRAFRLLMDELSFRYEPMPRLEVVFDRVSQLMGTILRNMTSDNVDVMLEKIETVRFSQFVEATEGTCAYSIIKAREWDNYLLISLNADMIFSTVDVLMGGGSGRTEVETKERGFTSIERALVKKVVEVLLEAVTTAFEPVAPVSLHCERLETIARFAMITEPNNALITAEFTIGMESRGGKMIIAIPYATLEPVREQLQQTYRGEQIGGDSVWESHILSQLVSASVDVQIELEKKTILLSEIMAWKKGSVLTFTKEHSATFEALCGDVPLFECIMGQQNRRLAVRITRMFPQRGVQD